MNSSKISQMGDDESMITGIPGQSKKSGVYFASIGRDSMDLYEWTLRFLDYNFKKLLKSCNDFTQKNEDLLEDLSMRFWFFEIRVIKNHIKALFILKSNSQKFISKSLFFKILELACSRIIENSIKSKDKSMRYSYR